MDFIIKQHSPYKITLPVFEGPLDLLLHLIKENEVDIYDIPIAKVTEQYLEYLAIMESLDLEVAGEFLVMAATLLEIKSRMLLPPDPKEDKDDEEPIDPRLELVERLIEYQRFKEVAGIFRDREQDRQKVFIRGMEDISEHYEKPTMVLKDITAVDLLSALNRMLSEVVGDEEVTVTSIQRRRISLRMRMGEIWRKINLEAGQLVLFEDLFIEQKTKADVVITFLALLELLKMGRIAVRQETVFGHIEVYRREEALAGNGNNG